MPGIVLRTNVKISDVRVLLSELSSLCATTLGKPESYISVQYAYDEHLMFAGTFDPTAMLSVMSLDNINPEVNERYCAVLFPFLQEKLGVPSDRAYISFDDPGRANLGYSGTTFSVLWREK